MNQSAQALGRLGKGRPKNFSKAELERRRKRFKAFAIPARWAEKPHKVEKSFA